MNRKKAVFIDRDGVINEVIMRNDKPSSPWFFEEFKIIDGAAIALEELKKIGFLNIIFTSQPDVARGNLSIIELEKMHKEIKEKLLIDEIKVCPHDDGDNCNCRKPKPGMLLEAAIEKNIDLGKSYVIGDTWKDVEAGKTVGCKTFLIRREYNKDYQRDYNFEVANLKEAVEIIKKLENL